MKPDEICNSFREVLPDYCAGDLPPERKVEFDRHLACCPSCKTEAGKQLRLAGALRSHFSGLPQVTKPVRLPEEGNPNLIGKLLGLLSGRRLAFGGILFAGLLFLLFRVMPIPEAGSPGVQTTPVPAPPVGVPPHGPSLLLGSLESSDRTVLKGPGTLVPDRHYTVLEQASLRFPEGSSIILKSGTRFKSGFRDLTISLGGAECSVKAGKGGFRVVTPCATLGIRGTEFSVMASPHGTMVELREGAIRIDTPNGNLDLVAGSSLLALPGVPPILAGNGLVVRQVPISDLEAPAFWNNLRKAWQPEPSATAAPIPPPGIFPEREVSTGTEGPTEPPTAPQPSENCASGAAQVAPDGFSR